MSKCIGGIAHDAASSLATHKPSKSFGDLFEAAGDSSSRSSSCRATEDASYAGCDGYEATFANPENDKTGLLDNNLSKKSLKNNQYG